MPDPALLSVIAAIGAPAACTLTLGLWLLLAPARPSERAVSPCVEVGVWASLVASAGVVGLVLAGHPVGELSAGAWLRVGAYEVPVVFLIDGVAVAFSLLSAVLTALVAQFSKTYLHKEPGYARFFLLLGLFCTGAQLVAFAGAFDVLFAGWELMGISSALFIGFFAERLEPVRSSVRAFATVRLCDIGFFLGIVATHELLGSTRLSVLADAASLPAWERNAIAGLFLLAALGKSAQLPFSSWLPRAMEGPTPSSALFYGSVSIHAGLYLMLRVWPLLGVAPVAQAAGVAIGLATAVYGTLVARVQTDAKGALASATLAQTGLILAEISVGLTDLALVHLVGHALLRVGQYLRAPNTVQDAHLRGHAAHPPAPWERALGPAASSRLFAAAIHRFRLDEGVDRALAPVWAFASALDRADRRVRGLFSFDGRT